MARPCRCPVSVAARGVRLLLLAALALGSASSAAQAIVARVNGVAITLEQLDRGFEANLRARGLNIARMQRPEQVRDLKREALDTLIRDELLWQKAQRDGTVASDQEVDRAIGRGVEQARSREAFERGIARAGFDEDGYRRYVHRMLSADRAAQALVQAKISVTDAEIEQFYRDNAQRFHRPEQLRLRVLQVRAAPGARERIEALRARLEKGEAFDALARRESDHPTRPWGGAMDPVARGQLTGPLEAAAFGLQRGELSGVVEAPGGLYVLKLEERMPEATVPFAAARERIREHLAQDRGREALEREMAALRAASKVEILMPQ